MASRARNACTGRVLAVRAALILAALTAGACAGDVLFVTGPMAGTCWESPRAQIDTIGWVWVQRDSSWQPALTCTTDPRIHINP